MRLHSFQHVPFETLAMIEDWAKAKGCGISTTQFFNTDYQLPELNNYDALVVMGGPMGVADVYAYPWLTKEKEHIQAAIEAGKPVLGICLGAQLIADVLGSDVKPNGQKEIGWFPIQMTNEAKQHSLFSTWPENFIVFHWHGDKFDIPSGAVPLGASQACPTQGFVYQDRVIGLQFHLEMDELAIKRIVEACADEVEAGGDFVQTSEALIAGCRTYETRSKLFDMLDKWLV